MKKLFNRITVARTFIRVMGTGPVVSRGLDLHIDGIPDPSVELL